MKFDKGETVICSITVRNSRKALTDPTTSMNIIIDRIKPNFENIIALTAMQRDGAGEYHYDFDTSVITSNSTYEVTYIATDGTRITKQKDTFELV